MNGKQDYPNWFLWAWEHGPKVYTVLAVVIAVATIAAVYYFDQRLDDIEGRLDREPPQAYQPPDLDAYAAQDVVSESIVVAKAVYVPVYSHVYFDGGRPHSLEATLSIRNTNIDRPIYVRSVRYYDTEGKLVKTHVDSTIRLKPLETIEFLVKRKENAGGSGANFIVDWMATEQVNEPVIEAVMVGMNGARALSFSSSGVPLSTSPEDVNVGQ